MRDDIEWFMSAGATGVLIKPFDVGDFEARMLAAAAATAGATAGAAAAAADSVN
jgi:hypothetical protein